MQQLSEIMAWFHLIFGGVLFIVFLITGQYMRSDFPDKSEIPPELRLLMRSRHIYILFSALLHVILGIYLQLRPEISRKILQYTGSLLLIAASVLLIWAFVTETYALQHFSNLSRYGIYLSLAGTILHLFGGLQGRKHDR